MKRFATFAVVLVLAGATDARAQHKHPRDIIKIDAALPSAQISAAQRAQVIKLRNDGERLHAAGNHGAAEAALERAKAILKIH